MAVYYPQRKPNNLGLGLQALDYFTRGKAQEKRIQEQHDAGLVRGEASDKRAEDQDKRDREKHSAWMLLNKPGMLTAEGEMAAKEAIPAMQSLTGRDPSPVNKAINPTQAWVPPSEPTPPPPAPPVETRFWTQLGPEDQDRIHGQLEQYGVPAELRENLWNNFVQRSTAQPFPVAGMTPTVSQTSPTGGITTTHQNTGLLEQESAAASGDIVQMRSDEGLQMNLQIALRNAQLLEDVMDNYGNAELNRPFMTQGAKNAASQLDALPYKIAIAYAKIFDPLGVAREGEVEAARKFLIKLGWGTPTGVSQAALKNFRDGLVYRSAYFENRTGKRLNLSPNDRAMVEAMKGEELPSPPEIFNHPGTPVTGELPRVPGKSQAPPPTYPGQSSGLPKVTRDPKTGLESHYAAPTLGKKGSPKPGTKESAPYYKSYDSVEEFRRNAQPGERANVLYDKGDGLRWYQGELEEPTTPPRQPYGFLNEQNVQQLDGPLLQAIKADIARKEAEKSRSRIPRYPASINLQR